MDLTQFRAALGDIPQQDHPRIVQQKSRDHYWYSPRLKAELENVTAQLVVTPRTQDEVVTILAAAYRYAVPVTPRGAGTGNYGQAMPLSGGVILDLTGLDRVVSISKDRVRAEAGIILEKLDEQTKAAVGGEMRFHPSTYRMATLGGFIAGGSGGVGSLRWGGLRAFGNLLGLKVITCEETPRILDLTGPDILKVAHAYGTNGIIVEAEIPLTAAYDWVDVMVGFNSVMEACAFAEQAARQDGLLLKEISPVAAPLPFDWFNRHKPYMKSRDQSVVLLMAAPAAVPALIDLVDFHKADLLLRTDTLAEDERRKLPPIYELAWNHTTLRGLKLDPGITYLQTQYPDLEHVKWAIEHFGDEVPMHLEMIRFDGKIVFAGLPIVRYTTEERLEEIIRIHEANDILVFNPHRYTLEEGGMKKTDRNQLEFKKQADPKGILNPGKMIAWDDPNFDLNSGRAWLFDGLKTLGAA
ncbi:MAG: FAD-binding oxidoreductase [Devosia sp.]|uniref:FAD-binding oxidoreductase n=1 Tax=Devosia sp. 66-22 TaxID=1895753 RepID=UPI00092B55D4|nr:FAD-binding oxidoreductase [Devosia sp. 66-22]MBN9347934.1 FAD-binding oxidoreductase [Devosia sp.]OJX51535.1 MAG: FAD-linked oxidase [Devosia sp. 66-22]